MKLIQIATIFATGAIAIAGSSAYTAALSGVPASKVIGAASTSITGATSTVPVYTYDAGKANVTGITFTLTGDTHTSTVSVAPWYDDNAGGAGHAFGTPVVCVYAANGGNSDYTCTIAATPAPWATATLYRVDFSVV